MKVVVHEGGRILDLMPIEELRPDGGIVISDLIAAIAERYKFAVVPTITEALKSGMKFEQGAFESPKGTAVAKELSLYNDGLITDSYDTVLAEALLEDFFAWATDKFKLRPRISPLQRSYTSAIVVEFERDMESALGALNKLCERMSQALKESYGWDYKYNLSRLSVSVDPLAIPQFRSTMFAIERRSLPLIPYSRNRYYCVAPLRTADHVRILEGLEADFGR